MTRLADKVRELAAAASPGPLGMSRFAVGASGAENLALLDAKGGIIAWFILTDRGEREANIELAAAFGSTALAAVEALEAGRNAIGEDKETQLEAQQLCAAVLRSWEQALGIAEEQSDGS